jgi:hypothetical protein
MSRRVVDSPTRCVGESAAPRLPETPKKIVSIGNLLESLTRRVGESFLLYEDLCKFEANIGTARKVV